MERKVYVNEARTIFVEVGTDDEEANRWGRPEIVNVAQREAPDHTWGPPTRVILEDS